MPYLGLGDYIYISRIQRDYIHKGYMKRLCEELSQIAETGTYTNQCFEMFEVLTELSNTSC
jgi:hypothetical protein